MAHRGKGNSKDRREQTKIWVKWFEKENGKKPNSEEGLTFARGFAMGWKSGRNSLREFLESTESTGENKNGTKTN